jgi:uroporphyrinogen III methyltransferase/synthase
VDLVPDSFISEGIVKAFENQEVRGLKILLPRAETARDIIPEGLSALGATVDVVTVYRTVSSGRSRAELEPLMTAGKIDVITFTSPSTVTNFIHIMGKTFSFPSQVKIACIGPVTAAAVRKAGWPIDILQEQFTIPGLVEAMMEYFKGNSR